MKPSGLVVVIKIGSASLVNPQTLLPKESAFQSVAQTISRLRKDGHNCILVSSGATAIGRGMLGCQKELVGTQTWKQTCAAVGQQRLMGLWAEAFAQYDQVVAQVLLLNDTHTHDRKSVVSDILHCLLQAGVVPIVNENDAIAPGTFNGNDIAALAVANMVSADVLALLTDVDCLYTKNPCVHPEAEPIEIVTDCQSLNVDVASKGTALGTGGMNTKLLAADIASSLGIITIINNASKAQNIVNVIHNIHLDVKNFRGTVQRGAISHSPLRKGSVNSDSSQRPTTLHTLFLPSQGRQERFDGHKNIELGFVNLPAIECR